MVLRNLSESELRDAIHASSARDPSCAVFSEQGITDQIFPRIADILCTSEFTEVDLSKNRLSDQCFPDLQKLLRETHAVYLLMKKKTLLFLLLLVCDLTTALPDHSSTRE